MSLKTRLLLLATFLVILGGSASWLAYRALSESILERWGRQVAEIQVRYDSARLLQSLEREIALARQMAQSTTLLRWAEKPGDGNLKSHALLELESFRQNFHDKSYFLALLSNGHYFYNAASDYSEDPFRYVLSEEKARDAWFFQLIEEGRDFHLNVNPDEELGVTKLWVDVLLRDTSGKVLGMVGTGLNLDAFLQDIVDLGQQGITTLFVDFNGAIQLYRDRNFIDFASIIKPEGQKSTIDRLFDTEEDRRKVAAMMQRLKEAAVGSERVESGFVTLNGRKHLAGIAFLPTIGWFEITLLDMGLQIPQRNLLPLIAVFLICLLVTLLLFHIVIRTRILSPLVNLEGAVQRVREGRYDWPALPRSNDEIGRLTEHFEGMAKAVQISRRELEERVAERTKELHELARVDALSGLKNRRGLEEDLEQILKHRQREGGQLGLMLLDVDNFKRINDQHGHQSGDLVLKKVAEMLKNSVRPYDHPGRWGGDEFLVILYPCDRETLRLIATRICDSLESETAASHIPVTVSVGAHHCGSDESAESILRQADRALYQAKEEGRNRVCLVPEA